MPDPVLTDRYELDEWVDAVASAAGDPAAAVSQLFVRYTERAAEPGEVTALWKQESEVLMVELEPGTVFPVQIDVDGPAIDGFGLLCAFKPKRICAGVWALTPSFNVEGVLHAFLVIHGVPDPAPWERLVILASGF
jgi:hypothetical protein